MQRCSKMHCPFSVSQYYTTDVKHFEPECITENCITGFTYQVGMVGARGKTRGISHTPMTTPAEPILR